MTTHIASCRCGALRIASAGEPVRVSVCHCHACQKRSGSAFSAQVRFPAGQVTLHGTTCDYVHVGDSGNRATFRFCATCSATIAYVLERQPDTVAVPLGAFDDPHAFAPSVSVYENRKHPWLEITGPDIEHD